MKTLFAKILVWLIATFIITVTGFVLIDVLSGPASNQNNVTGFLLAEALSAHTMEGPSGLAAYLRRMESTFGGRAFALDPSGRDLVSGVDRSPLISSAKTTRFPFVRHDSGTFFFSSDAQGNWLFLERSPLSRGFWIERL